MNYKKMQDIYKDDNRFYFVTNANISYQELEQEIGMQIYSKRFERHGSEGCKVTDPL